jgi:hypothetical protein
MDVTTNDIPQDIYSLFAGENTGCLFHNKLAKWASIKLEKKLILNIFVGMQ